MILGVVGPRDFKRVEYANYDFVAHNLDGLLRMSKVLKLVTGGSRGIEVLANEWALARGIQLEVIPPDLRVTEGSDDSRIANGERTRQAFSRRNAKISGMVDFMAVFWDGQYTNTIEELLRGGAFTTKSTLIIPMQ